jgi:quercetin dioxygenase-like cupin family protein
VSVATGAPQLLGPGEGEDIGGRVRIKCAREELALTETVGPGSTEPHIHLEHADAFRVLEGEFFVLLGEGEVELGPGDFALVPPGVVHCYRTSGARWLNLHAPDCGFAEYLRSGRDFDNEDPPEDGGRPASDALLARRGEGERLDLGPGAQGVIKAGTDQVAVVEFELGPGSPGPPPHRHAGITDSLYVLDGVLTVLLGDERHEARAGSYAFVPPGNVHTVSNPGDEPVRFLNVTAPGGFERYFRELAAAADPAEFPAIAARHDVLLA